MQPDVLQHGTHEFHPDTPNSRASRCVNCAISL